MSEPTIDMKRFEHLDSWEKRNSSWPTMLSYSTGAIGIELVGNAFGSLYFFFYETELLLGPLYIVLANVLFAIWNAVNDPLIGFISEKRRPFWKRWGKRGLWLAISMAPMYLAYTLVFIPPRGLWYPYVLGGLDISTKPWFLDFLLFLWLFFMLALADTFYSLFYVHWMGQFPEKFTTDQTKRKANVFRLYCGIFAVVLGNLLPGLLYNYDDPESYGFMAVVIGLIGASVTLLLIYGTRESPRRIAMEMDLEEEKAPFWDYMRIGLRTRSYIAYLCFYFGNKVWDLFVLGTVPYYNKYIFGRNPDDVIILLAVFIVGQMLSVPVWTLISKRIGFRKTMIYAGFSQAFLTIPFIFIRDYTIAIPFFFITGFGNGGMWTMLAPVFGETLDELSLKTMKRDSGVFVGISTFFGRFAIILFTGVTALVHYLTNFIEDAPMGTDTQPEPAKIGIQILLAGVPVLVLALMITAFAFLYDIKGEKKQFIEKRKADLGL